ncbi:MAG: hypothetical protein HYT31_02135 [Parcubacteria group bacterium]|nr:hypothetical protein [Parcubacteria group bacterium]
MSTVPRADLLGFQNDVLRSIVNSIGVRSGIQVNRSEDAYMRWITDEGYTLSNTPYEAIVINKKWYASADDSPETDSDFSDIITIASKKFEDNGYTLNQANYSGTENDYALYDYAKPYENDDEACSVGVNTDIWGSDSSISMSIACTSRETIAKNLQEQKPFLDTLKFQHMNATIEHIDSSGDFYRVEVGLARTGYYVVLGETAGQFKEIYTGQESPDCMLLDQHSVPWELVPACWDGTQVIDRLTGELY